MAADIHMVGLSQDLLAPFINSDPRLNQALEQAKVEKARLQEEFGDELVRKGDGASADVNEGIVNFYHSDVINRYVAIAAQGPWVITLGGAVLYDVGGYGMLGFGHNNPALSKALAKNQCMANVMTPSFSQRRFVDVLRKEIGHNRGNQCPYLGFLCLNSGSEAVGLAGRLSDVNAHTHTQAGGPHEGKTPAYISIEGSFHGRVTQAAHLSEVCHPAYRTHLASFQPSRHPKHFTAKMNDLSSLRKAFVDAEASNHFVELVAIEPVMGEGVPGLTVARDFYDLARSLTKEKGSLLLIDSIQAGLRTTGSLSIVDYPGFETAEEPDFETFSKALNGGQFPLSVLAVGPRTHSLYRHGTYGNTMTGNPRALDVAVAMISQITPEIRANIQRQGARLLGGLRTLQAKYPTIITHCEGLGLLLAANIDPKYPVVGSTGLEQQCRHEGLNIIHCGDNALRFTPVLDMTDAEVDLCVAVVDKVLSQI